MAMADLLRLDESLREGDVSRAWMVWSGAAEAALADTYRGCARFRVVSSVDLRFVIRVVMLLMFMMLVIGACSKLSWMFWIR